MYVLIGKKNVLERICGASETHILCLTHPFSQSCDVNKTHIICLKQPFSQSYGVHEAHILCLTHCFSNRMVSMNKACMPDTSFQEVTWFSC